MIGQEFSKALLGVYNGEQFGEAFFNRLLPTAENQMQNYILGSLLQLETEGKLVMRPLMLKFGLPLVDNENAIAEGESAAQAMMNLSWTDKFVAIVSIISEHGLPQYEALAGMVSAEIEKDAYVLALFMGEHERIILAAAENMVAGKKDPMAPLAKILNFPLVPSH